jgi:spermidine synthase
MGGTLPVIAQHWGRRSDALVGGIGTLYGINTLGAVVGVVATGFFLLPSLGYRNAIFIAALVNGLVGAIAFYLSWRFEGAGATLGPSPELEHGVEGPPPTPPPISEWEATTVVALALTGFAALALEVGWTRTLSLVVGPSVYAFSIMLATFLIGLSLGSLLFSWAIDKWRWDGARTFWILCVASGLLTVASLSLAGELPYLFGILFYAWGGEMGGRALFGVEAAVSAAALFLPTLVMGGLFPAGLAAARLSRDRVGFSVGRLYAGNAAGGVLGAAAAGFLLIPALGISGTIYLAVFIYIAVGATFGAFTGVPRILPRLARGTAVAAVGLAVVALAPKWDPLAMTSGVFEYVGNLGPGFDREDFQDFLRDDWEILYYREGAVSTVSVMWQPGRTRRLGGLEIPNVVYLTDGKADASSVGDMHTQIMLAHGPLLLHPDPKRALVIGLASGTTAGSALTHPLDKLDIVEIEPASVPGTRLFDFVNGRPLDDPRTTLKFADARSYLLATDERYDVIISEPSNPWMAGPANLFTREFFQIGADRLAHGGIFSQWIHMYNLDPELLRSVISTFHLVFPYVYVFNPLRKSDLILVGSDEPIDLDVARMGADWMVPAVQKDLARLGFTRLSDVLAQARLGPEEVAELGQGAPISTDDNGLILFGAPLHVHAMTDVANDQLLAQFSNSIAKYLRFPGATPEIKTRFLTSLADSYTASGFPWEAALARGLADSKLDESVGG